MNPSKSAPKEPLAKPRAKQRSADKMVPRRQMTAAMAEKRALGWADGRKIDSVALLRTLR